MSSVSAGLVGRPAPALRARQLGGGLVDLAQLRGYPVWIEFLRTCPSCTDQIAFMGELATRYAGDGLKVVAVDVGDDEASVASLASSGAIDFPLGLDADGSAARAWGVADVPIHFFVDASGVVRDVVAGRSGTTALLSGLAKVMPGVAVAP